jgi:predicted transcriptional regulator
MAYGSTWDVEKTTIYLSADTRRRLVALSRRRGVPQAELIREALRAFLASQDEPRLPSWVGIAQDGPITDSANIKAETREMWYREFAERMGWDD